MASNIEQVKELRELTGAGVAHCKRALNKAKGDRNKALEYLKEQGIEAADKLVGKEAKVGRIECYVHVTASAKGRVGAMVELTCQTDFVLKNEEFDELINDICLQVVGAKPSVVSREDIPKDRVEEERKKIAETIKNKPREIVDRSVEGRLEKTLYSRECLLDQDFINDQKYKGKVRDMLREKSGKFGENIAVRRFARFEVNASARVCDRRKDA